MIERGFAHAFGREPDLVAEAPGRVNLMGEHTDYNGGCVLPTAIPQRVRVAFGKGSDQRVSAGSANLSGPVQSYTLGAEAPGRGWLDYLQGITWLLKRSGHDLHGFDVWIESEVPMGSGLSSSAALEIALLRALRQAFGLLLADLDLARLGQRTENEFVGARVGIMDQMAASLAHEGTALFIDTISLSHEQVGIPPALQLAVIDSGIRHAHAGGGYNQRRSECEEAARLLGVRTLCELPAADHPRIAELPEPLSRRARHVLSENARVLATKAALATGDTQALSELFASSHHSQSEDFAVSLPELDRLVAAAAGDADVVAARLTGGGFGGSVVLLARSGTASSAAARVLARTGDPRAQVVLPR